MRQQNDGGPAFPEAHFHEERIADDAQAFIGTSHGMSLRDYFAAKAMAAFIEQSTEAFEQPDKCAAWAYEQADAMLKQREATS